MPLSLPQDDPNPEARARELAEQAEAYRYNRDYQGVLFADRVPKGEDYDARYALAVAEQGAEIVRNRASQKTARWPDPGGPPPALGDSAPARAIEALGRRLSAVTGHSPGERPADLSGYDDLIATLPRPLSMGRLDDDAFFAWQQVAGATPITLRGLTSLPENLPLDEATYARALGGRDRLSAALGEGRLFLSDYALFDRMPTGNTDGLTKYLWAPMALFARLGDGHLYPVCIQTGQRPGPDSPLVTPQEGLAWRMAKTTVQTAEMNMNGVVAHFGLCHAVAEAFICVTHRQLSPSHPIFHLLAPHFRYTLAVNETARTELVNPGGKQDRLQSGTLEANFAVLGRALSAVRYDAVGARAEFLSRGVGDAERLPHYPFRDDGVPVADALSRWAQAYVAVYYPSDEAVTGDVELRAWAAELSGPGGFGSMPSLTTRDALARFLGDMLWRLTGFHAVINYAGWDYAAWAPGMPSAGFGPGPRAGAEASEEAFLAMLPPLSVANGLLELMYTLRSIKLNRLGDYPKGHFDDPRLSPSLSALSAELAAAEAQIAARDAQRPWAFPFLYPSRIPNSIHV